LQKHYHPPKFTPEHTFFSSFYSFCCYFLLKAVLHFLSAENVKVMEIPAKNVSKNQK